MTRTQRLITYIPFLFAAIAFYAGYQDSSLNHPVLQLTIIFILGVALALLWKQFKPQDNPRWSGMLKSWTVAGPFLLMSGWMSADGFGALACAICVPALYGIYIIHAFFVFNYTGKLPPLAQRLF